MESRLYVGDAVGVLQSLPAEIAQTCVTSPPYFGLRDYTVGGQIGMEHTIGEYIHSIVCVFREIRRVLRHDGTAWIILGDGHGSGEIGRHDKITPGSHVGNDDKYSGVSRKIKKPNTGLKAKNLLGIPWRVAFALQEDGWYLRSDIIWAKPNPMPESVKDRPTKSHEYVFLLSQQPKYYYDAASIAEPATTEKGTRNKRDVWVVLPKPYKSAHFATFPPDLIKPCILAGSREGDVVIDPFIGSGTTAVVAASLGRRYIGIDINPEYITMAEERVRNGK